MSGDWLADQQRIKDEGNKKRAEAMQGVPYAPKGESRKSPEKVVPQFVARPLNSEPEPVQPLSQVQKALLVAAELLETTG